MNKKTQYCRFYLTRHGETVWNAQKRMQGHQDSPLTDNGISQAKKVAEMLKDIKFSHVFSSDLMRARRTAELIIADHNLVVKTNQLLREARLGPYEGKKLSLFLEELRDSIDQREALVDDEKMSFQIHPEIESYGDSATRMITFLREVSLAYQSHNILVVSHAGIIRSTLIKMGFASDSQLPHGAIKNTGYAVIESDGIDFFIKETVGIDKVS
jgi:broad specificity phosphatase PhoE